MVRLYFRPCSPTQYVVEGIRPTSQLGYGGAHCPVPVVLLFDAREILTRHDTRFTDGNLAAANAQVYADSEAFSQLPFEQIYHSSPFSKLEGRTIKFHRNAEVIVPRQLDLSGLRRIAARSVAEYETLRTLLSHRTWRSWAGRFETGVRSGLHLGRWTYLEQVVMTTDRTTLWFNPDTEAPGPFLLDCRVLDSSTRKTYTLTKPDFTAKQPLVMNLQNLSDPSEYRLTVKLDGHLAYLGWHIESSLPF